MIILILTDTCLDDISLKALDEIKLDFLVTEQDRLCCILPSETACLNHKTWYHSCKNLFQNDVIKIHCYLIFTFLLISNAICLILQRRSLAAAKTSFNRAFTNINSAINLSDLTLGVYLCLLMITDISYTHNFALYCYRKYAFCPNLILQNFSVD